MAANKFGPEERLVPLGPPRSEPAVARAPRTEFVVVTRSDELLEQLGQALDGAGEVRHADDEEEARQFVNPGSASIMLLDAREHTDPGLVVERLHTTDGTTVVVVFAPAETAGDIARAIKGSAAFAVLPIPVEMEKTRAVLHGAAEEALARRALVSPPAVAPAVRVQPEIQPRSPEASPDEPIVLVQPVVPQAVEQARPRPAGPSPAGDGTRRRSGVPGVAIAVAVLAVATTAWLYLRDGAEDPAGVAAAGDASPAAVEPTAASGPAPTIESPPEVKLSTEPKDELLDRARAAFHERRFTDPEGDNALHYYRSALAQDPQDGEALEGLDRIGGVLDGRLKAALAENRPDDVARTLELLRTIRPDDPGLAAAEARLAEQRIGAALARGDLDQAASLVRAAERAGVAPQRLAPLREQLARLDGAQRAERHARLVTARIRDGQLLVPRGDSAKFHLEQLLKLPNGARQGAAASDELASAFAERARRAAAQGQAAEAEQWLAETRSLGYEPARPLAITATPVAAASGVPATQPAPRTAAVSAPSGEDAVSVPAARPVTASTGRGPAPSEEAGVSAADFKRTRYVAPTYPPQALARGQSGEVRVRLTLDTAGRVADVQVLSASPEGVFDKAAIAAVRKWRFEPIVKDGRAIEASIPTTISFQPDAAARR